MSVAIVGYKGRQYKITVVEIDGHKQLYINNAPAEQYSPDLHAMAMQRAERLGLI
jgi:hypothetical protein